MHKSGWVHRDISLGNILVVDGVAKLSDLEYATRNTEQKELGRTVCDLCSSINDYLLACGFRRAPPTLLR